MKKITKFKDQKILVLGLARSGMAAALVLNELGAIVTVNDGKPFEENKEAQLLLEGVEFYSKNARLGYHQDEVFDVPAGFDPCPMGGGETDDLGGENDIEEIFE